MNENYLCTNDEKREAIRFLLNLYHTNGRKMLLTAEAIKYY